MKARYAILILFICINGLKIQAQNLLRNQNFDSHFNCPIGCTPNNATITNNVNNWKGNNAAGYFHFCGDTSYCAYYLYSGVPRNAFGYQYPLSDSGYIALYASIGFTLADYRGFAYQKMRQNLLPGKKYWVEYYTSLGDSANYAVQAMGATFCMDTLTYHLPQTNTSFSRPFKLENQNGFLTDKVQWTPLHWIYTADSAYQTFLMGYARNLGQVQGDSVFVGSQCFWCNFSGPSKYSFYYIDNAGVFPILGSTQTQTVCAFPQTLQGATGSDITYRQWQKDSLLLDTLSTQSITTPGLYTLTWRTDTTVHIDTFLVNAQIPPNNFLGPDVVMQQGVPVILAAPAGYSSYAWSSGEQSPEISVSVPGTYGVQISTENNCVYSDEVVVYIPTALQELSSGIQLYPNPAQDQLLLKSSKSLSGSLYITDALGRKLQEQEIKNVRQLQVWVSAFPPGLYVVQIQTALGVVSKKFVKE